MKQVHGEGVRGYLARVHGKANICALSKKCQCGATVYYIDDIIKWVILSGLSSSDIAWEVFGVSDIDNKTLPETIAIIEAKELADQAVMAEAHMVSVTSSYRSWAKRP